MKKIVLKFIASLLFSFLCLSAHTQPLHFVTASLPPLAPSADRPGFAEQVAREVFRRIGVEIEVNAIPGERAIINANSGIDDGDLLRIPGIEKEYPNLIRIPEKIMDFEFVGYTMERKKRIDGFAGLKPYTVAYTTGWKFYEQKVKEVRELTVVSNLGEMFLLLKNGRAEVVLADRWQGLWEAHNTGVQANVIEPPFAKVEMFMYLNKRHAALVPKAAKALAAMKADGTYQRIVKELLNPLETP